MSEENEHSGQRMRRRVKIRLKSDPNKKKVASNISESDRLKGFLVMNIINYTFFFILAYLITYFLSRFTSGFVANMENKGPFLNYNYILFWAEYTSWDQKSIISIFASGVIANLFAFIVTIIIYVRTRKREGYLSSFLLWLVYFSFIRVFGGILAGVATHRDFGFLTMWIYLSRNQEIVIIVISAILIGILGLFSTRWFLQTSMSNSLIQGENRMKYVTVSGVVPYLLGSTIIMISHLPTKQIHEFILLVSFGILFVPMYILIPRLAKTSIVCFNKPSLYKVQYKVIVYTCILLIGLRVLLGRGLTL